MYYMRALEGRRRRHTFTLCPFSIGNEWLEMHLCGSLSLLDVQYERIKMLSRHCMVENCWPRQRFLHNR